MEKIDKYKLMATLVRGFFGGYASGIIDCHVTDPKEKFMPQTIKKVMLEHYETIADMFHNTLFFSIAVMNFDYEDVHKIVVEASGKGTTMIDLVKIVCATEGLHQAMVAEYKRNFELLLGGHYASVPEHFKSYTRNDGEPDWIDTDKAIRIAVRTVMTAYARGIRNGGTGKASLHQPTLFRLLLDAMTTLLCDSPLSGRDADRGGLNGLFMKACHSKHNIDVMTDEMELTYNELVETEGIIANDDRAN